MPASEVSATEMMDGATVTVCAPKSAASLPARSCTTAASSPVVRSV